MSTLSLEALLAFKKAGKLHLCQHVICHNPAPTAESSGVGDCSPDLNLAFAFPVDLPKTQRGAE